VRKIQLTTLWSALVLKELCVEPQIAFWEAVIPYVEYSDAFKVHREVKEAYRVAKAKLHELMGRNRPLTELME
jgi:hypothetical protein